MDSDSESPFAPTQTQPPDQAYLPGQRKSLEGIAIRSFCLGITFSSSVIAAASIVWFTSSPLWRLPYFLAALSTFHFLEFWTTAKYSTADATVKSFLLTANWPAYAIAHTSASIECLVTNLLFPDRAWAPFYIGHILLGVGLVLVACGQLIRSLAMVQAGASFNHVVQWRKKETHILVTTGIYSVFRHPSYFGFFWWAVGTQLVLGNIICLVGYVAVLWKFFSSRVKDEEAYLIQFFGRDYVEYKQRVSTKIPFIN